MGLFEYLKNLNKKEEDECIEYQRPSEIQKTDYEINIPDFEYIVDNREYDKPVILIMDDFKGMATLLKDELKRVNSIDVYKDYTIVLATGDYAAFTVKKELLKGTKIDIGLLDITLGGVVGGIEYDGVDVAIMIKEKYPDSIVKFVTGHTLNRKNPEIFQFMQKFENHFNIPIDESYEISTINGVEVSYKHIIQKNSDRVLLMEHTLKEYEDIKNDRNIK